MPPRSLPYTLRAGPAALRRISRDGLAPGDIGCIPAAAGGPKGLALLPLDRLLLQHGWLPAAQPLELLGASIGAWRAAALAQQEPLAALDRVQHAYVYGQDYNARPAPGEVSAVCRRIAQAARGTGTCAGARASRSTSSPRVRVGRCTARNRSSRLAARS